MRELTPLERKPSPSAPEAEIGLLGSILIDPACIASVIPTLSPESFWIERHRDIYRCMVKVYDTGGVIDPVTILNELGKVGSDVDAAYLLKLAADTGYPNAESYARIVEEKAMLRNLSSLGAKLARDGHDPASDPFELLDEAEGAIFQMANDRIKTGFVSLGGVLRKVLTSIDGLEGTGGVTGVSTGYRDLDALTGGWQATDLIILAGRPSSGKTALALSLARNAERGGVGIFSLEMSSEQLVTRLVCAEARIDMHLVRTGKLSGKDRAQLRDAAEMIDGVKIYIDDTASLGLLELRAKARRLRTEKGIGLLVVDYLQLMQGPKGAESREREVAAITRSLKGLAKELKIPVIALSQLNRSVEGRTDKRPILSDLRESGAIEQDADVVAFVHRPEMYEVPGSVEFIEAEGRAEIVVAKQRNGPVGSVDLAFIKKYARFESLNPYIVPTQTTEELF